MSGFERWVSIILAPLFLAFWPALCLFGHDASATTTIYAANSSGYYVSTAPNPTQVFYPYKLNSAAANPFVFFPNGSQSIPNNFVEFDMGQTTTATSLNANQAVYFAISSTLSGATATGTTTTTTNNNTYAVVSVLQSGGTVGVPVPIAFAQTYPPTGWVSCAVNGSGGVNSICSAVSGTNAYAAYIPPGGTTLIAIYPYDICNPQGNNGTNSIANCNGNAGTVPLPSPTSAASLTNLSVSIRAVTDPNFTLQGGTSQAYTDIAAAVSSPTSPTTPANGALDTPVNVEISLQGAPAQISCPDTAHDATIYFPGDTSILLNTTGFNLVNQQSGPANLLVLGNYSTSPNTATVATDEASFNTPNEYAIEQTVQLGSGPTPPQTFGGVSIGPNVFLNSTTTTSYYYTLAFTIIDQAGFVASPSAFPSPAYSPYCEVQNVQASQINGFLNKNACFIANAAYGDTDAAPVQMLREFRDAILVHSPQGRAFVRWYYHWSPPAADWLRAHPVFRPLVLLLLLPVEALAWATLNPALSLSLLFVAGFGLLCFGVIFYGRREEASR
ncbi:MAG: hypothetical protein P4M08_02160 [Oligoflexia bacterium]|nr:hypothetical protein [Oligoflexia bacterium]